MRMRLFLAQMLDVAGHAQRIQDACDECNGECGKIFKW